MILGSIARTNKSVSCMNIENASYYPLVDRPNQRCIKCHSQQTACSRELELILMFAGEGNVGRKGILRRLTCPRIPNN